MMAYEMLTPPIQSLRVSTGWEIRKDLFFELEPDAEPKFKSVEHDDGWLLFDFELLICNYENDGVKWILDMGWIRQFDPNGRFMLNLIKDNYSVSDPLVICETRSLTKITDAINDTMLRVSRENGNFTIEAEDLKLQELRPYNGWTFVKNEFFDLEPEGDMKVQGLPNNDGWQLMKPEMLLLEAGHFQIKIGWSPAHSPDGHFQITAVSKDYFNPPLVDFSSRDKAEIVEIIEHLMKNIDKLKPNRR